MGTFNTGYLTIRIFFYISVTVTLPSSNNLITLLNVILSKSQKCILLKKSLSYSKLIISWLILDRIYIYIYIYKRFLSYHIYICIKMQFNRLIRFDPNFFPSSQRWRLSISVWWGYSEQCCQGSVTSGRGLFWKYSCGKNYRAVGCGFLAYFYNVPRPPKVYLDK